MTQSPPTKSRPPRQRIIEAAADLFHKQGVVATSPNEIMALSQTGKSQFYHYFRSKAGLVHQVLQHYISSIREGAAAIDYEVRSWPDLTRWLRAHAALQARYAMTRGCPFGTIGNELTENDELVRQDLALLFEVVRNKLAAFFVREKASRRLKPAADEAALADFCITSIQGAMLLGKIRRDRGTVDLAIDHVLAHLSTFRRS
jgi:TetR/AcrR family transcriptional regulator, transcriptional repressor for nem operon